jgi:hypothetical protein
MGTVFAKTSAILILGVVVGTGSLLAGTGVDQQCSLAVVSRELRAHQKVCDSGIVQEMARKGQVFQQNQMGIGSILAIGPDYNSKQAVSWFQRAAQQGYAPAEVNLAVMYANGWGTKVDYGTALHWFRAAADQGFARAYYNLGILYMEGKAVRQDYGEALRWFQKGANAGDSSAQTNLGYMYDQGLGCARNVVTAGAWYRKAAETGNPLAQNDLADMYLRGEGVGQSDDEAFRLFQEAAAEGQTGARIKLGYMYAQGRGTKRDPQTAFAWVKAASMAGDPRGKELLRSLETTLTPEQVTRAEQWANSLMTTTESQISASAFVP